MLPMRNGCSLGSLKHHGEEGCLGNDLRLQEAVFSHLFFSLPLGSLTLSSCSYLSTSLFYIKNQGWATMAGQKEPDRRVAGDVAHLLAKLKL
jgi:hypothetical protein